MKSRKNSGGIMGTKGYYIALILCAAAIGISGYLYYRNVNQQDPQLNAPPASVDEKDPDNIQAVSPDPSIDQQTPHTPDKESPDKTVKTCIPVKGNTVSEYAMDCLSYNPTTRDWRVHNGIDIAAPAGTTVCAAAAGTVYTTFADETMGTTVVIRHDNGYVTTYSSLAQEVSVAPGDQVTLGQTIGQVGNTALLETAIGEHLHFSVSKNDNPMDPMDFLSLGAS